MKRFISSPVLPIRLETFSEPPNELEYAPVNRPSIASTRGTHSTRFRPSPTSERRRPCLSPAVAPSGPSDARRHPRLSRSGSLIDVLIRLDTTRSSFPPTLLLLRIREVPRSALSALRMRSFVRDGLWSRSENVISLDSRGRGSSLSQCPCVSPRPAPFPVPGCSTVNALAEFCRA